MTDQRTSQSKFWTSGVELQYKLPNYIEILFLIFIEKLHKMEERWKDHQREYVWKAAHQVYQESGKPVHLQGKIEVLSFCLDKYASDLRFTNQSRFKTLKNRLVITVLVHKQCSD